MNTIRRIYQRDDAYRTCSRILKYVHWPYVKHVVPLVATYAYVLLRNHFHLFVRIRETFKVSSPVQTFEVSETSKVSNATQAFSNFFNAYAKGFNKTYGRTGGLFAHRFRRIEVDSELYGMRLVHYIHFNPQKHGFVADFRQYPYSSYQAMLSNATTKLQRGEVLEWFDGLVGFEEVHRTLADEKNIWRVIMEEE